jgi:pseudouridine-5'-phosphate glycosidase
MLRTALAKFSTATRPMPPLIRLNAEVKKALDSGKPVVALESTIISHGRLLPYLL